MNLGAELSWLGELSDLAREIITRRQQRAVLEKLEALEKELELRSAGEQVTTFRCLGVTIDRTTHTEV